MTHKIFCAGFGGQGVMTMGQLFAYAAMYEKKEVTWCPSYGPEMRGGEANCTVVISDTRVGCPLIKEDATTAIFMNEAAYRKFITQAASGGHVYVNSSLIREKVLRDDVQAYYVPVNELAGELGNEKLANIVMLGAVNAIEKAVDSEDIIKALKKVFDVAEEDSVSANQKALAAGESYMQQTETI